MQEPIAAIAGAAPAATIADAESLPFRFSGRTDEYFRIWIVNLALTIVTLGVYSAWAKVRSERYFYGNTTVGGTPFEYLAEPLAILKGRAIAALLLLAYVGSAQISPLLNLMVLALLALLFPWMLTRSLAFRARYSAWRSIRFGFDGRYGSAFKLYILYPVLTLFTLYLAFPLVARKQTDWIVNQHRYGGTRLAFSGDTAQFYAVYLLAIVGAVGVGVAMAMGFAWAFDIMRAGRFDPDQVQALLAVIGGGAYLCFFAIGVYVRAAIANLMWNGTRVGDCGFRCTISGWDMAWLFFTNTLAIICSLGLAYPWARIRVARYRAEHLYFVPVGDPDQFFADAAGSASVYGSEAADLFDVDISW